MFACIDKIKNQKSLYFSLNRILTAQFNETKLSGIYAIYKNGLCLYVGQSSNIASRLSTHISGKYSTADRIEIFENYEGIEDIIPSEKYLIQHYKPIENIIADYSERISGRLLQTFEDNKEGVPLTPNYELILDASTIFVHNLEIGVDMQNAHKMKELLLKNIL